MLELKHISFEAESDEGVKKILKDVSLTIDERMVVITGPNGSGKSTLAKIIAGIEKPTEGQIILDGEDITGSRSSSPCVSRASRSSTSFPSPPASA